MAIATHLSIKFLSHFSAFFNHVLLLKEKRDSKNFWTASFVKSFFPQTVWSSGEGATWFVVFVHHDDYGWWQSMLVILPALLIESRAAKPREIPLCHCISASSIIKRLESSRPNFQKPKQLFISFQNFVKRDLSWIKTENRVNIGDSKAEGF